jgi:hypothetical protein
MQRRRRKRFRAEALVLPTRANEMWTMDYTHDELAGGRKFRTLNLMDGYTREALRIEPDTSLPGLRGASIGVAAGTARDTGGDPGRYGSEFASRALDACGTVAEFAWSSSDLANQWRTDTSRVSLGGKWPSNRRKRTA